MNAAPATQGERVIDRRVVNALFPQARAKLGPMSALAGPGVAASKKLMGGLWVGGDAVLTDGALSFQPNRINRSMHKDPETLQVTIPLNAIASVEDRRGMVTQIIDLRVKPDAGAVNVPGETFSVRCYRARAFSEAIRKQAGLS